MPETKEIAEQRRAEELALSTLPRRPRSAMEYLRAGMGPGMQVGYQYGWADGYEYGIRAGVALAKAQLKKGGPRDS